MLKKLFNRRIFSSLFFVLFFSVLTNAQDNSSTETTDNALNIELSSLFGGVYYVDPIGFQLSGRQAPFEGVLDLDNYKLGTNDLISIKIEAGQPLFLRGILVNAQGDITIPILGSIKVEGLTVKEAEDQIRNETLKQFRDTIVRITVESPRPAIIHITGGVPFPGKYIIPAQSRVDQAIFSSITSGNRNLVKTVSNSSDFLSNANYSFRSIKLYHPDGTESEADLINYFRTGDLSTNPFVKDGDLISITRLNREASKISISGAVKSEYEIEFKKGDTPSFLLDIGGGFETIADTTKLFVFRRGVSGIEKMTVESKDWNFFQLQPNDRVVATIGDEFDASASAWVYGEVNISGNFPIISGETSAFELLTISGGLTERALPSAAYLTRGSEKNGIPNQFNTELMKRTSDQVLQGLEYLDAEMKLSQNKVFINLQDEEQLKALKVLDGDRLYVPRDAQTIFVFGQVNNPGFFPFTSSTKSISEYLSEAGGFSLSADKDRVFILKAGNSTWYRVGETNLESGDRIFVDRLPVEELNAQRTYEIQRAQLRNQRTQLIMTGITTITGIITTYVAIRRL